MKGKLLLVSLIVLLFTFVPLLSAWSQDKVGKIGFHNNGYVKILKVQSHELGSSLKEIKTQSISGISLEYIPEISGTGDYVEVLVEVLRELSEGKPHKICVHYYDSKGAPMPGDSQFTDLGLSTGEIRAVKFEVPEKAQSFEIWLPKIE